MMENKDLGASSLRADRVTDAPHEACKQSSPFGSVPTSAADGLVTALQSIVDWQPEPYPFPSDWHAQIEACDECKRYSGHPIQQGICDTHRRPLWAREAHDEHQSGPARASFAWLTAHDALRDYARATGAA